ncbi:cupin domain-containing protein [Aeromonas jandaei]
MLESEVVSIIKAKPFVISRNDIPTINHVEKDGNLYHLGQLKDFRKVDAIKAFMPNSGRSSLSWVSLKPGEELKVHEHPIESMIMITSGNAKLTGDTPCSVKEGDIVCVPRNTKHGFIGEGKDGFWGISVQFEERGLYEDPEKSLVKFEDQTDYMSKLKERHEYWKQVIAQHSLFESVNNESEKRVFLRVLKNWSDSFQHIVLIRSIMVSNPRFMAVTQEHLEDEYGHNRAFDHLETVNPSLKMQAVCSWFNEKMRKIDDEHRVVFMNLAIEGSATVFYGKFYTLFSNAEESEHFEEHQELDHTHEGLGMSLVNIDTENKYLSLLRILDDTWGMISELYSVLEEDSKALLS